jgi:hypothetical protein
MDESIQLEARFHSGDVRAEAGKDGITLTLHGDEERAYADFDWDTAATLGAWLVGWGNARGIASRTIDAQGTGF